MPTLWAKSQGTYPLHSAYEWAQVLAPADEYDNSTLVGSAGWVVAPEYSGVDVPFSHPFGFDWEFQIALDDDAKGYPDLLSPANAEGEGDPNHNSILLANALGLSASRTPRHGMGQEPPPSKLPSPGGSRRPRSTTRPLDSRCRSRS